MRCSKCSTENPDDAKYCIECAAPLAFHCPQCGRENPSRAKFCADCAAPLSRTPAAKSPDSRPSIRVSAEQPETAVMEGERKTVTAMFADIKGSTELEQDLDPEDARAIVDPALKLMIEAVQRYDGYVVQSTGDGIFAIFGAPVAHEDHPQRALYAALRLQDELKRYSSKLVAEGRNPLEARIGANTGEVVVRSISTGGKTEYTPIGHTANLASRMQAAAPTGSIAVSEQTRKLVEGYFTLRVIGPTKVKGVSKPVGVYEVTGLGPLRTRLQRAAYRGFTKFVGRDEEMAALDRAAELAKSGRGQIVAVVGEPGVGKSRLFFEFNARHQSGWKHLEAFSVSHGKAASFTAATELLKNYFGIDELDEPRLRREKIAGRLAILDRALEDTLHYLFSLFGLNEGNDPLAGMDANIRRRRTLDAIKRILIRESLAQPLIVVFEDLHWIDDETQALLNQIGESIGDAPILLALNYRTEYRHDWGARASFTQIRLEPLKQESADEMLAAMLGVDPSLAPLRKLIREKSVATPFFIEEMVQTLFEEGALVRNGAVRATKAITEIRLPSTVNAVLASRIDRLPAQEKELLQTLAVVGNEFPLKLVREVSDLATDDLDSMLSHLQDGEFIHERPVKDDFEYRFKHALTHDVAYTSILAERRRALHEQVGSAIESLYPKSLDDHLADLGHHFRLAGHARKAATYLLRGGALQAAKSAFPEAVHHLSDGLELVKTLPENAERSLLEWDLLRVLTVCLTVTSGAGSPMRGEALSRMEELCDQSTDNDRIFYVVSSRLNYHGVRDELDKERELSERAVEIAEHSINPAFLEQACSALGYSLWKLGMFRAAREQLERAIATPSTAHHHTGVAPTHFRMFALTNLAFIQWILGYPEKAAKTGDYALKLVRDEHAPASLAFALIYCAELHRFLRLHQLTGVLSGEAIVVATRSGFSLLEAQARFEHGWSLIGGPEVAAGLDEMNHAMDSLAATGARASAWRAAPLAEAMGTSGHAHKGLELLNDALARLNQTGERFYEAEIRRLIGELTLLVDQSRVDDARRAFDRAIRVARQQEAKSLELRATTSLARLLRDTNRRAEARAMLADIYSWFTEGFDTADLKDAKVLLDELSA